MGTTAWIIIVSIIIITHSVKDTARTHRTLEVDEVTAIIR